MQNVIQLENSLIAQFCSTAEKVAEKIQNLGKNYQEILQEKISTEDYKTYITEKISQTPRHFSRINDDAKVILSDEAIEAMKNNPDYEKWVLNRIADEMNFPDYLFFYPGNNGKVENFQFGETKEDYRGVCSGKISRQNFAEKSYWELRLERLKKQLEAEQEYFMQQQELKKIGEKIAERRANYNAAIGLSDEIRPQMPITGVPASLLLSLLGG